MNVTFVCFTRNLSAQFIKGSADTFTRIYATAGVVARAEGRPKEGA